MFQQPLLAWQSAAIAGQLTVGADHPMARDYDADRIQTVRGAHCPTRSRPTDRGGELTIAARFASWNLPQGLPNFALKRRAVRRDRQVVDRTQVTVEIRVECAND